MIKLYKLVKNEHGEEIGVWKENQFNFVPFHESNRDYQEYLKWLEEGNTPEPADE
jgi:hypothetical protein